MNTQLNSTQPDITLYNLNADILQLISDMVLAGVERDEEHALWLVEFNEAIAAIKGTVSKEHSYVLENAPWFILHPYGYDMFLMGLRIGRDPMSILTLDGGKNKR